MPPNSFVLIGAGSTVFTPGLMTDLASSPVFAGWTIHLVDLSAEAAQTMARLGRRIARERGADLIPNLPPEAVVEVPAVAGAAGITGLAVGPLPEAIAAVLTARVQQQELTVRAALSGRRAQAIQALALDPLVPDPQTAAAILDDAIAAHGGAMGRFAIPGSAA